jgi:hypothetical protein
MTVSSQKTIKSANGDGSNVTFPYDFKIFAAVDLTVILRSSTGTETVQELTTHYSVTNAGVVSGGNVVFETAPASGVTVVIRRNIAQTQITDYTANDPFPAESHEDALDRLTFITQQQQEEIDRSFKVSRTNTISSSEFTTSASDRANKLISFDGNGNLVVTEGKVDTVTVSASAVAAGGNPTASASYTASSGALALALGLPTGATGATGNQSGLSMTFSNSTSDADPGAGKVAFNNGTVSSVTVLFVDDADDNGVDISSFVQSWDDVSNATARGFLTVTKEGTPSTYAIFKVSGAVTDASGYTKVAVTHVISNGTFSNADGVSVQFVHSGADGAGDITGVTAGTNLSGGGDTGAVTINLADATVSAKGAASFATADFTVSSGAVSLQGVVAKTSDINTFTKAQIPSTFSATLASVSGVLNFDTFQNFIVQLASGSQDLDEPTTEDGNVGQTGVIIFIQPSSGNAGSVSLHGHYETAGAGGATSLGLSATNDQYDVVPYIIKASGSVLLGTPQLNFG